MKITILCVGKIKEKFYRDAIAEYEKRLSRYCKLEMIEVSDTEAQDIDTFEDWEIAEMKYRLMMRK